MKIFNPIFLLLALSFMLLTNMTCKKSYIKKNELPPVTQTGANTFGCYVNGEIFLPRKGAMYGSAITATKKGSSFYIKMADDSNHARVIVLEIEHNSIASSLKCIKLSRDICSVSNCSTTNNNIINVKVDETNKIISGQFNAILPATDTCLEVKITEGRFDLKYTEN